MAFELLAVGMSDQAVTNPISAAFYSYGPGVASGIGSGLSKLIVGHPFDTIKVRMYVRRGAARRGAERSGGSTHARERERQRGRQSERARAAAVVVVAAA